MRRREDGSEEGGRERQKDEEKRETEGERKDMNMHVHTHSPPPNSGSGTSAHTNQLKQVYSHGVDITSTKGLSGERS